MSESSRINEGAEVRAPAADAREERTAAAPTGASPTSRRLTPATVLALQRSAGNAGAIRALERASAGPSWAADSGAGERILDASAAPGEVMRPATAPREGDNGAANRGGLLQRQPAPAAAPAAGPAKGAQLGTGYTFELPEGQIVEFGQASYITGGLATKGEVMFQPVAAGSEAPAVTAGGANQGVKVDVDLAKTGGREVRELDQVRRGDRDARVGALEEETRSFPGSHGQDQDEFPARPTPAATS